MTENQNVSLSVGASMLAMVVNDNAGDLTPRGALSSIASKLAPTVVCGFSYSATTGK